MNEGKIAAEMVAFAAVASPGDQAAYFFEDDRPEGSTLIDDHTSELFDFLGVDITATSNGGVVQVVLTKRAMEVTR